MGLVYEFKESDFFCTISVGKKFRDRSNIPLDAVRCRPYPIEFNPSTYWKKIKRKLIGTPCLEIQVRGMLDIALAEG